MSELKRRQFVGTAGALLATQLAARAKEDAPKTVRIGCIGVGNRGSKLLNSLLKIEGVQVKAICDINSQHVQRAQNAVAAAGQAKPAGIEDWKKLLELNDVDAVASALPCDLHAANYLDVLAAGKDLYGEKPMCLTVADCDAVVAATKTTGRIVQIGFQRRADPRFIETVRQVHGGEIGDLVEGRVLWSNWWGPLYDWFGKKERSGDWMVEQAVHNWDVMNWANNCLPVRASGMGRDNLFRDRQPDRNVHDYYTGNVEFANGVFVNIIHSWIAPGKFNEEYTRLIGVKGGIDFNSGTFSYRPDQRKPDRVGHNFKGDIDSTLLALKAFINSVRTRTAPVATVEHGRNAVLSCLLMRQAVYSRKVVEMKELLG